MNPNLKSLTIPQFCADEQISEPTYYKMRSLGLGPKELRYPGLRAVRITIQARDEWRERMQNPTRAAQKQIESDHKAWSKHLSAAGKRSAAKRQRHNDE